MDTRVPIYGVSEFQFQALGALTSAVWRFNCLKDFRVRYGTRCTNNNTESFWCQRKFAELFHRFSRTPGAFSQAVENNSIRMSGL
jgi:hypothetical protein